jgi:hypothetical protein
MALERSWQVRTSPLKRRGGKHGATADLAPGEWPARKHSPASLEPHWHGDMTGRPPFEGAIDVMQFR